MGYGCLTQQKCMSYTIDTVNSPQCELCLFFIPNINPINSFEVKYVHRDRGQSSHIAVAAYFLFCEESLLGSTPLSL